MSSLSAKSAEELSRLLDEYGIKHGPIVDSTRNLYEKKLMEAMAKNTKPSTDKTYYREEQDEITFITYHPAVKHEGFGDLTRRLKTTDYDDNVDTANEPIISHTQTTYQSTPYSSPSSYTTKSSSYGVAPASGKSEESKSGGVSGWLRILVFIIIALFLYYVYSNMESTEESPIKAIDN